MDLLNTYCNPPLAISDLPRFFRPPFSPISGHLRVRNRGLLGHVDGSRRTFFCGIWLVQLGFPPNISPNLAQTAEKLGPEVGARTKMAHFCTFRALASWGGGRFRDFFTFSDCPSQDGSNGVSYPPNLAPVPLKNGPKSQKMAIFGLIFTFWAVATKFSRALP